mmetsp:Transcript_10294/g.16070  ORF Transcript_10294/g.16070 Transcript_10294/m.16070 type:complete len:231 (-) Transcript_10294:272-964(-)
MSNGAAIPLRFVNVGMPADLVLPGERKDAAGLGRSTSLYSDFGNVSVSGSGTGPSMVPSANSLMSVRVPWTAAAAAMAGDTKCVLPPPPWRPSKFLLEVEAHLSCGRSLSGFMARHILQPGSRQSKPASTKILSSPSLIACSLTSPEPGTTMAYTLSATLRPLATMAAARRSSMRALVQDPMKTLSIATSESFSFGFRPMYSKALSMAAALRGSSSLAGSGTVPVIGATS